MKKLIVSICLLLSIFTATIYADESKFWNVTSDNSYLRNRIDFYNNTYFDGKLKVTYINYKENLLSEINAATKSYYWANPYKQVIVVDSQYFNDKSLDYLDSYLLDQLCCVYCTQFYPDQTKNLRDKEIYKEQVQRLRSLGLKVISFSNSQQQTTQSSTPLNNNSKTNQNSQPSNNTNGSTKQDEINQVLSIFKSYEYKGKEYWSGDEEIFYDVYDNHNLKLNIKFEKAPRFDKNNVGSTISLSNQSIHILAHGLSSHYPVQEFINKVRSDPRVAVNGSTPQVAQTPKQNQNTSSQQKQSSSQQQAKPQTQQQQKTQPSASQNNNSTPEYTKITIAEYYAFESQYYNKKVCIDAYLLSLDEQCFMIYDKKGGVVSVYYKFPADTVRELMNLSNHKVRVYAHGIKYYGSINALFCDKLQWW